ncbi:MAG: xylan esterase [Cellvibrio sp.]|nr:xylan esterase [Cellvibrio sp.]
MKKLISIISILLLTACQQLQTETTNVIQISASDSHITIMGRTHINADKSVLLGYPGVSFFLEAEGTQLSVNIKSNNGNSWIDVIVDEQPAKAIKIGNQLQKVELFSFVESGKHKVRLTHRSENWHGNITINGFSLNGKQFLPAPELPKRKLLVLGDSVTCGAAIDRVSAEQKNTRWWNARESYGMLIADSLNAQVHLVCWGGRGLIRSWNGKTDEQNLPDFYELAVGDNDKKLQWDHPQYQPDLIISAMGTNDFSSGIPDRETYVSTYVKFIQKLRGNHPQAEIMLIEGSILNGENKTALVDYLAETVKRVNDSKVHQGKSSYHSGDASDAHPTKEQHALMAKELTEQIKQLMGW